MIKHEIHCTMNPNRTCRMCWAAEIKQKPMEELRGALGEGGIDKLTNIAGGCPACILSALRQSGRIFPGVLLEDGKTWEFRKEAIKFWDKVNGKNWEREMEYEKSQIC